MHKLLKTSLFVGSLPKHSHNASVTIQVFRAEIRRFHIFVLVILYYVGSHGVSLHNTAICISEFISITDTCGSYYSQIIRIVAMIIIRLHTTSLIHHTTRRTWRNPAFKKHPLIYNVNVSYGQHLSLN